MTVAADRRACRAAGSGGEHFQDRGIGRASRCWPRPNAARTGRTARATEVSAKLAGKPRRHVAAGRGSSRRHQPEPACATAQASGTAPKPRGREAERPGYVAAQALPVHDRKNVKRVICHRSGRQRPALASKAVAAQFVTILAMQSRMTRARNSRSI